MSIKPIPVKLPPSFEKALGYNHNERWVAFYWMPCGDEAMYDDGLWSTQCNWWAYQQFNHHPAVRPWLVEFDFGSSEDEAKHWLLCDLTERALFAGPVEEVREKLIHETHQDIPPNTPPIPLTPDDIHDIIDKFQSKMREMPVPTMEQLRKAMEEERMLCDRMIQELNSMGRQEDK